MLWNPETPPTYSMAIYVETTPNLKDGIHE